jgi:predicted TIM-barrel fold metal-dependent hydrolase
MSARIVRDTTSLMPQSPLTRRQVLAVSLAATFASSSRAETSALWGLPVVDCHLHLRQGLDANYVHMQGCEVSNALLLSRATATEQIQAMQAKYPGVFAWTASTDITKPDAGAILTAAVKQGALGFGEIKFHVASDGPELRRMYALAADLNVPILIHFQEVPHFDGEGVFSTGFQHFETILKAYPKTKFVGHADAFWANISADYQNDVAYPTGPIKPGGITDKLLADYPNLFGDLSANSCNNALSRDAEFTHGFLARHQDKLIFGSDCSCSDGKGGGISQSNNPVANRMAGKCVARETLSLLKRSSSGQVFRKITWENGHRVWRIPEATSLN